jgi:glucokinase
VAEAARQEIFEAPDVGGEVLLAADVGGTYARIGVVQFGGQTPHVSHFEKYRCADYPNLSAIFERFLVDNNRVRVSKGAIAIAGYVLDDNVINNNLPWSVSLTQVRRALGFNDLQVVNDFTAVAHATNYVTERDVTPIAATSAPLEGPVLVVGPGTGLGAAVRIPTARSTVILSTEAGQAALTASTDLEIEILKYFLRDGSHVPTEHVLSGPGLANLYAAVAALRGEKSNALTPREIADTGIDGSDAIAAETLRVFCGWLGSIVGNFVLLYGAQGGVHLAGGILPQISKFLISSDFTARFRDKGAMRKVLERVPVSLIEHGQLGVLGAARWYVEQHRNQ